MPKPTGSVDIGDTWSPECPLLQSWWLQRRDPGTHGESPGRKGCLISPDAADGTRPHHLCAMCTHGSAHLWSPGPP